MTKQYQDLFKQFIELTHDDQIQKIRDIRHSRNIERPATARKRVVKEEKTKRTKMDKTRSMLSKMTPEQVAAIKNALQDKDK